MQFIVNNQIAIEAETPEQALEKTKPTEGNRISFSVNPRPQPTTQVMPGIRPVIQQSAKS